jgi:4-hydroxy-tetrahydrodipicolinate synthase
VLKGSLVALVTPFDDHNRVDYAALKRLIEFHVAEGSNGLVVAGTTGESATLARDEHVELIARGIDGYLVVVPYYNKPMQEGMYRHFCTVADAVDKPVMLYNVPGRTVADLLPETVARLSTHENIWAIKEATGSIDRLRDIQALVPAEFGLFSGDDFTVLPFIEQGGHGVVTVSGNVAPALMGELCRLAGAGEHDAAKAVDDRLQPLNTALFVESNPIPVKWAVSRMGLISPFIRLPLTEYSERYHEQMRAAMAGAGVEISA